ncbi:MAG TPA: ABC transporter ATP-binding protein [Polyangiaceae bacterium]|nr:ABC transporter ATP-binding protein [Polyangiaceae bacterium]
MTSPVVEAVNLAKRFDELEAVRGVSFRIERGRCFGFLGPNGAGKTSTMRMVQAVSMPTGGKLSVLGMDPAVDGPRIRARLGVVPQEDNLDPDLNVEQNLAVYARYFHLPKDVARRRVAELIDFVALSDKATKSPRELSGGMKRRLVIARALVNEPELVILDEPTTGLDPQARHRVWQRLRTLKERGVTMALTTHYMDEAERLCDELVIMDGGRIIAEGAPADLVRKHVGEEVVELRIPEEREAEVLSGLDLAGVDTERAGDVRLFFVGRKSAAGDAIVLRAQERRIPSFLRSATLEDVFLRLTGRELSE